MNLMNLLKLIIKKKHFMSLVCLFFSVISCFNMTKNKELLLAAEKGDLSEVKRLIESGANVNTKTFKIRPPGVKGRSTYGRTALLIASREKHKDIVEYLIKNGADVNAKSDRGDTALMFASLVGEKEIVELLINNGADVNAKSNKGFTALMRASFDARDDEKHREVIKILIKHGADVNAKSESGNTALKLATESKHKEIADILIKAGATDY